MNTTYFLNCIAGNIFGTKTSPILPTNYYLGLSTTTPTSDGTGVTEPLPSTGYARVILTSLSQPLNGAVVNTMDVNFNEATSTWGLITHYVVYDSQTDGNLLMFGELSVPRFVDASTIMTVKREYLVMSVQNDS